MAYKLNPAQIHLRVSTELRYEASREEARKASHIPAQTCITTQTASLHCRNMSNGHCLRAFIK